MASPTVMGGASGEIPSSDALIFAARSAQWEVAAAARWQDGGPAKDSRIAADLAGGDPQRGGHRQQPVAPKALVIVRIVSPVWLAALNKRIAAFLCLFSHVGKPGGLPGKHLLASQPVIGEVERKFQHPNRLR